MALTFDSYVLSAAKLSGLLVNPPADLISSFGVTILTLATPDVGLVFNKVSPLSGGAPTTVNIQGSTFSFDKAYQGATVAVIKVPVGNQLGYTVVNLSQGAPLSGGGTITIPTSALTPNADVWDDRKRFLRLYGYI